MKWKQEQTSFFFLVLEGEKKNMERNEYVWMFYCLWEIFSQVPLLDLIYYITGFKSASSEVYIFLVKTEWITSLPCYFHFLLCNTDDQNLHCIQIQQGISNIILFCFLHSWHICFCYPLSNNIADCCSLVGASWDLGIDLAVSFHVKVTLVYIFHWETSFPKQRCCVASSQLSLYSIVEGLSSSGA